ncbi:hypothetical protein GOP47_0024661 [Adiantum capillus-veneris]|uniref:Gag1-like clamp domain-containing protein n=1 Tax=Adiantum capillus-veneris TaxID=13818 RepID=A0A9D4U4V3_ADICA|nr:hypothetical protein GOP47_0024661 [Adiantum capillus-veneris]
MYGNSGCIGIRAKASSDIMVEKSSAVHSSKRGLRGHSLQSQRNWWATSSGEMENQRRPLEQNTPRSAHDQDIKSLGNEANGTVFVNHALLLWEEQRRQWVGNRRERSSKDACEPVLSAETTYEDLLTTSRPFPRPVPLKEMMQFLVKIWMQEGLYDPHH